MTGFIHSDKYSMQWGKSNKKEEVTRNSLLHWHVFPQNPALVYFSWVVFASTSFKSHFDFVKLGSGGGFWRAPWALPQAEWLSLNATNAVSFRGDPELFSETHRVFLRPKPLLRSICGQLCDSSLCEKIKKQFL